MSDLVIHPYTEKQLKLFAERPSHTLLLAGPTGSGKLTLAIQLASNVLGLQAAAFADYPYKLVVSSEDGKIGIDTIRELDGFLSLKVPRQADYNRAVIIENAQGLGLEAQNALLKTLEEPPAGVLIILTVDSEQSLLPTIRSRAQSITVKRPEKAQLELFFGSQFDQNATAQAYAVSAGLPGLMKALLQEADHPLLQATDYARRLLSQSAYERLLVADELSKQKQLAADVAFILQQMAHVSLQSADNARGKRWQAIMEAGYQASEALAANAQPKLAVVNLMLNL